MAKKIMIEQEFKNNKLLIDWLVRWRRFFGIQEDTPADHEIAYIIHKVHQNNKLNWQRILREVEKKALQYEPGQRVGYFNLISFQQEKRDLFLDLKSKKADHAGIKRSLGLKNAGISMSENMILGKEKPYWFGAVPESLPDWYFVAKSSIPIFAKVYEGKALPLEEKTAELDAEEYYDIAQFKQLFQSDADDLKIYNKHLNPFVAKLEKLLNAEVKLREKMMQESDVDKVLGIHSKIHSKTAEQLIVWKEFEPVLDSLLQELSEGIRESSKSLYNAILAIIEEHL